MAITHFIIEELPNAENVISYIGNDQLFEDTLYPIEREEELAFDRIPSLEGFYHSDSIKYRVYDQETEKYSNLVTSLLKWEENDLSVLPQSEDNVLLLENKEEHTLLSLLPINETVEFVEIVSMSGYEDIYEKRKYKEGDRLSPAELNKNTFNTGPLGGGFPYFEMVYKIGRDNIAEDQEYKMTINIEASASLVRNSQGSTTDSYETEDGSTQIEIDKYFGIQVKNGSSNGTAQLRLEVNSAFLNGSDFNQLEISSGNKEFVFKENGTHDIEIETRYLGSGPVTIRAIMETDLAVDIVATLLSINNQTELVDAEENTLILNQ